MITKTQHKQNKTKNKNYMHTKKQNKRKQNKTQQSNKQTNTKNTTTKTQKKHN